MVCENFHLPRTSGSPLWLTKYPWFSSLPVADFIVQPGMVVVATLSVLTQPESLITILTICID